MRLAPALRVVTLIGAAVTLSVVVAEAALRLLVRPSPTYHMLLPGTRIFEPDVRYIHGIHGSARYVVNENGIRGRDFGPDGSEFRVLLVGGSTTECSLLDETENWGWVAQNELKKTKDGRALWLGNVGRSGLTSRDHIVALRYLLPQYPKMDLIVVLLGVNDLTVALRQGTSYRSPPDLANPEVEAMQVRNAFAVSPGGYRESLNAEWTLAPTPWYKKTRLYHLAKQARTGWQARQSIRGTGGVIVGQWREHRKNASQMISELPDLTKPLADYRHNLETIVREAREANTEIIFLTQPSLWKPNITPEEEKLLWLGGNGRFQEEPGHSYYTVPALAEAMRRFNGEALAVCREQGMACMDLASLMPGDSVVFYDDVHFTEAGAVKVGKLLAAHLRMAKPNIFGPDLTASK